MRIKEYFAKYTTLHPSCMHGLEPDQKRLQDTFSDTQLKIRYNRLKKCVQVWYDAPSGLHCLLNMEGSYNLGWAIRELRERQRTKKQLAEMYTAQLEARDKSTKDKIDALARETAEVVGKHVAGKVTVSGIK